MPNRRIKGTAALLAIIGRDPSRGKAFWWLYDHYDNIAERAKNNRIPWQHVLAEVRRRDLTNANGRPVSDAEALKTTFNRVSALKRRETEIIQLKAATQRCPANDPPPLAWDVSDDA